jgi:hypothetical protein
MPLLVRGLIGVIVLSQPQPIRRTGTARAMSAVKRGALRPAIGTPGSESARNAHEPFGLSHQADPGSGRDGGEQHAAGALPRRLAARHYGPYLLMGASEAVTLDAVTPRSSSGGQGRRRRVSRLGDAAGRGLAVRDALRRGVSARAGRGVAALSRRVRILRHGGGGYAPPRLHRFLLRMAAALPALRFDGDALLLDVEAHASRSRGRPSAVCPFTSPPR